MRSVLAGLLFLVCGVAHAAGHHDRWGSVKRLARGTQVFVQTMGSAPEFCAVVAVDDAMLRCDPIHGPDANWPSSSTAPLVFTRAAVTNIWVWEEDLRWSRGTWFWVAASAAFEIWFGVDAGIGAVELVGGPLVAILWAEYALFTPRHPKKMRRRLIYEVQASAVPDAGAPAGATP